MVGRQSTLGMSEYQGEQRVEKGSRLNAIMVVQNEGKEMDCLGARWELVDRPAHC